MIYFDHDELRFPAVNRDVIQVFNETSEVIPAYTAAVISSVKRSESALLFFVTPAVSDTGVWGIAAEDIMPGSCGTLVVNGVTRAFITAGSGNYVLPSVAGLTAVSASKARIIYRTANAQTPGVILMGHAGDSSVYSGEFSIRYLGDRTFQVIFPEHDYAGRTDLPGVEKVPIVTITVPENSNGGDIILYACHKDDKYSVVIMLKHSGANPPDGYFDYVELGNVYPSGRVDQYYTRHEEIQFSRTWFL